MCSLQDVQGHDSSHLSDPNVGGLVCCKKKHCGHVICIIWQSKQRFRYVAYLPQCQLFPHCRLVVEVAWRGPLAAALAAEKAVAPEEAKAVGRGAVRAVGKGAAPEAVRAVVLGSAKEVEKVVAMVEAKVVARVIR